MNYTDRHMLIFDAFYYFGEFPRFFLARRQQLSQEINQFTVHTTGANFHPVPGTYVLPQREGSYSIFERPG